VARKRVEKIVRLPNVGKRVMKQEALPEKLPELRELTPETISKAIKEI
jgi:hypothetical protein